LDSKSLSLIIKDSRGTLLQAMMKLKTSLFQTRVMRRLRSNRKSKRTKLKLKSKVISTVNMIKNQLSQPMSHGEMKVLALKRQHLQ
jgi:hypothetical protein